MKRVLMVAYHFPPLMGSSGIQRTLRFAQHLPAFGWSPIVLTVHPRAYEHTHPDLLADLPPELTVIRAPAWDAARHFAIARRYPGCLARPDRWSSWRWGGIVSGRLALHRWRPAAIWSTYPIATAHLIGAALARSSKLPWVADFRDPMAQDGYPPDPAQWRQYQAIEQRTVAQAAASVFAAPSALAEYQSRYPAHAARMHLIENGYNDSMDAAAPGLSAPDLPPPGQPPLNPGRLTLLHSGIVYPSERDPTALFAALAGVKQSAPDCYARLRVRFRGAVHEALLHTLARTHAVEEAIEVCPLTDHHSATREMQAADGLLVLQASNCNQQIPAKLYEYLACRKPILIFADPAGDTARIARSAGLDAATALDDASAIAHALSRFVASPDHGTRADEAFVARASRHARTGELAALLDRLTASGSPAP